MADDLDDFLKQAALRRQQRQQQKAQGGRPAPSPPPKSSQPAPPVRSEPPRLRPESTPLQDNIPVAEVVEYSAPYVPTVGNLATSLPSVRKEADYQVGSLPVTEERQKPKQKKGNAKSQSATLKETPATAAEPQPTAKVSSASLIAQLRDPQTLRMAIIAHEIMKRPWQ